MLKNCSKTVTLNDVEEYRRIEKKRGIYGMIDLRRFNPSKCSCTRYSLPIPARFISGDESLMTVSIFYILF